MSLIIVSNGLQIMLVIGSCSHDLKLLNLVQTRIVLARATSAEDLRVFREGHLGNVGT
jgi:hypothetical protein